ncbi:TPA: NUDIX hydrolase [candidate division WWE3 bacterium]|uniref:NUDIX hydrolase n=1 Tax=candidate division WWE3 bacterium TaxID=2053526 RepID=A0A656PM81_UNCKA|nr:NUDIX hydrolase [candidate division WWE3 bacterium RAAC2_WWE3_1]KKS29201.1 MAG: NUDIX hydrolase [candidate division WWE3 bacterium GW2011_GWB1_42_117]KKS54733.1 MAG: NUDIX hydrolase [candidate division WWE3 bacterium GW2011_GWD2_42_34]KKT04489.1 MAG: NUDIX hydrolase [candidate division WWE3 bacterium GW2011_GWE2_43_18]KKT06176.1 MAG: NUDIX hydrolase [candidate division WWE3 bacterium GW2011_GWF2_43_18]KKT08412.1 MAG: NUDIX hydrolase [candidate division WWE3 bacterium GW2011_GWD1_43_201]KKT
MRRAVAGIVLFKNKVLIGKKIVKEGHFVSGGWHIPGGHVEENENDTDALMREFQEETQLKIRIIKKLCDFIIEETDTSLGWFICSTDTDKAVPGDDLTQIDFVDKTEVATKCDSRAVRLWPSEVIDYLSR